MLPYRHPGYTCLFTYFNPGQGPAPCTKQVFQYIFFFIFSFVNHDGVDWLTEIWAQVKENQRVRRAAWRSTGKVLLLNPWVFCGYLPGQLFGDDFKSVPVDPVSVPQPFRPENALAGFFFC